MPWTPATRKMSTSEEVEIVIRESKKYWACPYKVAAAERRMKALDY